MKRILVVLAALSCLAQMPSARADELTEAKRQDVLRLLDLTGAFRIGQLFSSTIVRQMTDALRSARPDIPTDVMDILPKAVDEVIAAEMTAAGGFADLVVDVYQRHFTHEDVRGLIAFYETPLGRKLSAELPAMTQESMQAGMKWGVSIAPKIQERVKQRFRERGVDL
jgi:uncharacterized protein